MLYIFSIFGRITDFIATTLYFLIFAFRSRKLTMILQKTLEQTVEIGINSIGVVVLTSVFTGMVLALQTGYSSISIFSQPLYIGSVVGFSMLKELGPVLTSIVVAGRAGAATTAEIGTMKVTEQLDALQTLGTSPYIYLVIPRIFAFLIALPVLTVIGVSVAIAGGAIVAVYKLDVAFKVYWDDFKLADVNTFMHGFLKTFFFAVIVSVVATYKGFRTAGGAEGVGRATTASVVTSMILILVLDYFISQALVAIGIR